MKHSDHDFSSTGNLTVRLGFLSVWRSIWETKLGSQFFFFFPLLDNYFVFAYELFVLSHEN